MRWPLVSRRKYLHCVGVVNALLKDVKELQNELIMERSLKYELVLTNAEVQLSGEVGALLARMKRASEIVKDIDTFLGEPFDRFFEINRWDELKMILKVQGDDA